MHTLRRCSVAIVGPGQVGLPTAKRWLALHLVTPANLILIGRRLDNLDGFRQQYPRVRLSTNPVDVRQARVVYLAVKPRDTEAALRAIAPHLRRDAVVLTTVAAHSLAQQSSWAGSRSVIRVMLNLALAEGQSSTRWYAGKISAAQRTRCQRLIDALGPAEECTSDREIDLHTVVSGTGLAAVMYVLWGFIKAAVYLGMRRHDAQRVVLQLARGVVVLLEHDVYRTPEELTEAVKTPGGTTSRAEHVFDGRGVWAIITDALSSAHARLTDISR